MKCFNAEGHDFLVYNKPRIIKCFHVLKIMPVCFIVCRHAERDRDVGITQRGMKQARRLGRNLLNLLEEQDECACIVTSKTARAVATGEVLTDEFFPHVKLCQDADLDEVVFKPRLLHSHMRNEVAEADSVLFLRIQRSIRRWLEVAFAVDGSGVKDAITPGAMNTNPGVQAQLQARCLKIIFITHSGWIHACMRLFCLIPPHSTFFCVHLASMHALTFPCIKECARGGWGVETAQDFSNKKDEVDLGVSHVAKMWRDLPTRTWGKSRVLWRDADWLVREDVWKMERWRQHTSYMPLLAIAASDALRCLRDLNASHVDALKKIDRAYPDSEWVKFLLYPPYVWRLHVHIQRVSCPMSYKNVYLLRDVITMASRFPVAAAIDTGPALLVYKY